jgi:hypothetical protein
MTPDKYRQKAEEIAADCADFDKIVPRIEAGLLAAYAGGAREMRERAKRAPPSMLHSPSSSECCRDTRLM